MDKQSFIKHYLEYCEVQNDRGETQESRYLETRTREGNITDALRFRIFDPLWMLSRQWQLGEFRGNDAGTAMSVNCQVKSTPISLYSFGDKGFIAQADADGPLEPFVERIERAITPLVRVESATYFMDLIYDCDQIVDKKIVRNQIFACDELQLDQDTFIMPERGSLEHRRITEFTTDRNTRFKKFKDSFFRNAFDGYKLYKKLAEGCRFDFDCPNEVFSTYFTWFEERYIHPVLGKNLGRSDENLEVWDTRSLGYRFGCENAFGSYSANDYEGGRVSWYSFDLMQKQSVQETVRTEKISTLPSPATYPGAPNKRLWEFEDRKVFLGNSTGMQAKGNVAFLQYATMYSNDWMLCPLKTELGRYIEVDEVTVYDSFGVKSVINRRAGEQDGDLWQMFTNAPAARGSAPADTPPGLLFPPSLAYTLEGEPIEQVNFLRDEMANMVWGVETRIDDGCGSYIDASLLASEVQAYLDEDYEAYVKKAQYTVHGDSDGQATVTSDRKSDFKYVLMNSVPLNWIPFVPQHVCDKEQKKLYAEFLGGRDVVLRRGKMPCYFKGRYLPVRPMTDLLKTEKVEDGEKPFFINEEEVQGVGTQVVKNCQRSRWIGGKTYTWMGYSKQIKYTQGNSGLEFDNLVKPKE